MLVWIQNPFDNLPIEGYRRQRYWLMAEAFVRAGHEVVYWTSDFSHSARARRRLTSDAPTAIHLRFIETVPYTGSISLRRLWSHWRYACRWECEARRETRAPKLIITSCPTLTGALAALRLGRRFNAKVVVDVQDAWPETFERIVPRFLLLPLRLLARRIYRSANLVTGVCDRYRALVARDDYYRAYLGVAS